MYEISHRRCVGPGVDVDPCRVGRLIDAQMQVYSMLWERSGGIFCKAERCHGTHDEVVVVHAVTSRNSSIIYATVISATSISGKDEIMAKNTGGDRRAWRYGG